jgi:hypothetical protein
MECVYILESVNVMKAGLMKIVHERYASLHVYMGRVMSTRDIVTVILDSLASLVVKTYESVMSIMETVSRSVLIFLVDITVPVWMGSVHRQMMKAHVKTLMSVWETMAAIRRVLTLLDLTTATVNVAFSSSITLSVMI